MKRVLEWTVGAGPMGKKRDAERALHGISDPLPRLIERLIVAIHHDRDPWHAHTQGDLRRRGDVGIGVVADHKIWLERPDGRCHRAAIGPSQTWEPQPRQVDEPDADRGV